MLDYKGIEALYTVQELQSFEAASKKLHITQSAVSQRIKNLESFYGEPALIRTLPYKPTPLGERLIGHFKQLQLLEDTLQQDLNPVEVRPRISIAINRDSLETWFQDFLDQKHIFENILLEIIADDQELTLDYFKKGIVSACLSTSSKELPGSKAVFLGHMDYFLVCSPGFAKKHFSNHPIQKSLLSAPAIKFDSNDKMHERYLEKFFGINGAELSFNVVPSVRGFKKYSMQGYGYGLIPRIDIECELKNNLLIHLEKDKLWSVPLYWHLWDIDSTYYRKINLEIIHYVKTMLSF
ncbi:MAG: ArgP/LysG family DNA-binding transcriptional regulator [Parachlamydiales bacterium]|jgi:LysR family transcriptional regulator (chromosome initiation inhibitor)